MPPVKDRLLELQQVGTSSNGDVEYVDEQVDNGGSKKRGKKKRKEQIVTKTLEKSDEIRELIENIKKNVEKIRALEDKAQDQIFRLPKIIKEINEIFQENATIAYKIATKLKQISVEIKKIEDDQSVAARMKKVQFTTLRQQFLDILNTNNELLEKTKSIEKENLKNQIRIVDAKYDDEQLEELLQDSKNPFQVFTDNHLITTEEAKRQLADIEERHKVLLELEERLVEVRDLFRQIAVLIDMQQESVNRIEHHAGTATEYIEAVDLDKVRKHRNKYLRRKCYLIVGAAVLVVILIVAIIY